ncbi:amylo-alpha-1,6-glucosidase [Pelagibacterium sp.]|uniref:amylo-alpha-1,6-glucosidase n=1 Tax=Pelagibacterium sp. TaxID=1967288 RepID=UPI003A93DAB6
MNSYFDIASIPFSRRSRFLTLSSDPCGEQGLWLRLVRGGDDRKSLGRIARVELCDENGNPLEWRAKFAPHCLNLECTNGGSAEFAIGEGERLHIHAQGCTLRLHVVAGRYNHNYRSLGGSDCIVIASENIKLFPRTTQGRVAVSGDWHRDRANAIVVELLGEEIEASIDLAERTEPAPSAQTTRDVAKAAQLEFAAFAASAIAPPAGQVDVHELACYVLWANAVPPAGLLQRPAIYMSKNAMINVWSWDNAFTALGTARIDPELSLDQFFVIFDHQDKTGLLPDYVNDREALFAFTKPPVHGWAINLILARNPQYLTPETRDALVVSLERQVDYWLTHTRSGPGDLPTYFHGNDSGWDNATFFENGGPVATPDLVTFLILTLDCLSSLAPHGAQAWQKQASQLTDLLVSTLWNGTRFVARQAHSVDPLPQTSLVQFMPLLLGNRLSAEIADRLIARLLADGFVTEWGLATESPASAFYESDGYWRGPIWAPTTALILEGLIAQNRNDLALSIARKFCALVAAGGMAENFDALTGEGLRDQGFAWTAAVYLLCCERILELEESDH